MDVSQILSLLGSLSIGLDNPSDSDIAVYINYLNIAYTEILQETLSQNAFVPIVTDTVIPSSSGEVALASFSQTPFIIKSVYDSVSNLPLTATTYDSVQKRDPARQNSGLPLEWYFSGGSLWVYPAPSESFDVGVSYIAQPALLTKDTKSSQILIPALYQYILADGAAYYVFQSETGFKDQTKQATSAARWIDGKQKLFAYYKNFAGKKNFSTFSYV